MDFEGAQMQAMGHLKSIVFCRVLRFLAAGLLKNAFRASIRKCQKNVQFGTPLDQAVPRTKRLDAHDVESSSYGARRDLGLRLLALRRLFVWGRA